ncbi:hypothetical protein CLF_109122 [Clonorchis sinensis]|uniref:Uncharacterized protein n=1 Tax=Clonorchis sinensis TaxID=79923 RepID=G7YSA0_CLOSI|nr:hypothetical protein CLF_109122 [Clonorchis sinensis]
MKSAGWKPKWPNINHVTLNSAFSTSEDAQQSMSAPAQTSEGEEALVQKSKVCIVATRECMGNVVQSQLNVVRVVLQFHHLLLFSNSFIYCSHLPQGTSRYRFHVTTQLSAVVEHAVRRRHLRQLGGYQYHLESWPAQPGDHEGQLKQGQKLDLNLRLSDVMESNLPLRFILVRENSRSAAAMVDSSDDEGSPGTGYSKAARVSSVQCDAALKLRQYSVTLLKGSYSREVQLHVSSDGIKVEQAATSRRRKLFSKFKTIVHGVHTLADCEIETPARASNTEGSSTSAAPRTTGTAHDPSSSEPPSTPNYVTKKVQLKIIYLSQPETTTVDTASSTGTLSGGGTHRSSSLPSAISSSDVVPCFQHLCFETQWSRARAICDQLNLILECSGSRARQLYMKRRLAL